MSSLGESPSSGDCNSKKPQREATVTSPVATKPKGQTGVSPGFSIGDSTSKKPLATAPTSSGGPTIPAAKPSVASGNRGKAAVPSGVRGKAAISSGSRGKAIVSADVGDVISFREVTLRPHEGEVRFRLIHFLEARNALTKLLIGLEMLLIDEEGFIPPGRSDTYLPHMKAGTTYRLNKFFGSKNKDFYRVADPSVTISFSWNSVLSVLEDSSVCLPEDRFRFHAYKDFDAACDLKGDLYDYLGHIKLVNGAVLSDSLVLDEAQIASTRRVLLHVQTHDGPVMKLYLWDHVASDFAEKFKASGGTARVILATTLNPKRFGGALSLSSMTPSRVFVDNDVQATRDYLSWLSSNLDVANRVNAEVVTKTDTVTIGELFSYMKQATAKVACFECTATIDDVVQGGGWYYIGCGQCHTKATKSPSSLMCKKCGKSEIIGVPHTDQASFVLLGDAGQELTGKKASELVESYVEDNEVVAEDHLVPLPQVLLDTIGQICRFSVKVSNHNLTGKTQSSTVTKVLLPEAPEPEGELEDKVIVPDAQKTLQIGAAEDGPSTVHEESADETLKRCTDVVEEEEPKRVKRG